MARDKANGKTSRDSRAAAPCGCAAADHGAGDGAGRATHAVRAGVGPGGHAAGVDATIKAANLKHLRRIEGQVRGIAAMVEDDRYCADIITQVAAARESLLSVARNLMRNHVKHCAASALDGKGAPRNAMLDELLDLVGKIAR